MKRRPFLSVVIASQDAGAALCFTLDSLFAQDCRDLEVVVQGAENAFSNIAVVPKALFP